MPRDDAEPTEPAAEASPAPVQYGDPLVCPHCIEPVGHFDHFCPECGGPITAHASIDPLGQVYAAGRAYQRATSPRPKFIVTLGIWLIFGPQLPFLGMGILWTSTLLVSGGSYSYGSGYGTTHVSSDGALNDVLGLLVCSGLFCIYALILWKTTRRYLEYRRERSLHSVCPQCQCDLHGTPNHCRECGWEPEEAPNAA